MFTGIIEEIGVVKKVRRQTNLNTLDVSAHKVISGIKLGDSVAVNGVCLTVTEIEDCNLRFDVMLESLDVTTIGLLKPEDSVNLERALRVGDRLSGHFVSGHVDAMTTVTDVIIQENYKELRLTIPGTLSKHFVVKGSVCVDGVSLTIGDVTDSYFAVYLIPFTANVTTLGLIKAGDKVNVETDIIGKYIISCQNGL